MISRYLLTISLNFLLFIAVCAAQTVNLAENAKEAMLKSTRYMVEEVSTNGGYVWYYTPDLSRRWGEMEAYKSMIWMQDGGTVSVGHILLEAYTATGEEYYYDAAAKAARAIIEGQSRNGGWNYMIDFAGETSLRTWYNTIGKNAWRLEEFQHYYGNDTFDDDVTSDAARFLLKMYLQKKDAEYKPAIEKAINFILKSQYANGGWPQRYPVKPDYTSYFTFNDDVIGENVNFLIQCYQVLKEERFVDPISRGMNFYLISQQQNGSWAQQYNMKLEPASARTYEPAAILPSTTFQNCFQLLKFYEYTGERKFLTSIPDAINWLEQTQIPDNMTEGGRYTHPLYIEPTTGRPLFAHRKGANVIYGNYYIDYHDTLLLAHMYGKRRVDITYLKNEYNRVNKLSAQEITKNSPLAAKNTDPVYFPLKRTGAGADQLTDIEVQKVINALDNNNRWLVKHALISNPYIGDGKNRTATDKYASTQVGDQTDTSPFRDVSETEYISTPEYVKNMNKLINYINSLKK